MSSGVQLSKNGAVYGEGSADVSVLTVGYRPRRVELYNEDGLCTGIWMEGMTEGRGMKQITAGTISLFAAGEGITPLSNGFKFGQDSDMNVAGEKVFWVAHE